MRSDDSITSTVLCRFGERLQRPSPDHVAQGEPEKARWYAVEASRPARWPAF